MPYTNASQQQKDAVATMVERMMKPTNAPTGNSFTLGWDVVASYSEKQINKLLSVRHGTKKAGMLRNLVLTTEDYNPATDEPYTTTWNLNFGPPMLQFDAHASSQPMCSIQMDIISGTKQVTGAPKPIPTGWKLQLNGIPLATARGKISDEGEIEGGVENIVPGDTPIHFGDANEEHSHVVLGFHLDKDNLKVLAISPDELDLKNKALGFMKTSFQEGFLDFFTGNNGKTALSYSIASVNSASAPGHEDLKPVKFQFATFAKGDLGIVSIFIQVKGGFNAGTTEGLQSLWQAQWLRSNTQPIPEHFTASLILSSEMIHRVLLQPGFQKSNWDATNATEPTDFCNRVSARNHAVWKLPVQDIDYSAGVFHVDGPQINLHDFPLKMTITQKDPAGSPEVTAHWQIEKDISWEARRPILANSDGHIHAIFRLCDPDHYDQPRKMDCTITLDDEAFGMDLQVNTQNFRMDQNEENAIEFEAWQKGMRGIWTQAPNVKIGTMGLGFLRTTNLLTPDARVVDFNEEIGLKAPKDFVLVGDILDY
ncbi:hypothetical protein N7520_005419 [Penicillium odoratum]|uniref:uncharacterized protein n=1 Tax=Penicillium odoratum TaxID=1167516 RepID=UPI0025476CEC|nr:uncharacterized protein N7520_005419 [Penicillium odoratum]KAJ5765860.1 hypothetical protein N7520_005419 [Penicillium odoratum]